MAKTRKRPFSALREFLGQEAAGGYVLMAAAVLALALANSPFAPGYFAVLDSYVGGHLGPLHLRESVLHWINDGLMAVFFLLVGLELKREVLDGQLRRPSRLVLPAAAALAGVAAPALIYSLLTVSDPAARSGWAIPAATDIAFALGVLALAGPRVPSSLKMFLTTLAVLDDLAAILIIAVFYTDQLHVSWLAGAAACTAVLVALNRAKVHHLGAYALAGLALWYCVLESGVHATLAGVVLALTVPLVRSPGRPDAYAASPLHRLEHRLHKPVAFFILPVFGLANAGLALGGLSFADVLAPVPLGIGLGLFLGKQLGVFLAAMLVIKLGWSDMPKFASSGQLYGVSALCGVGFTMSLFVGSLSFDDPALMNSVKLGVLVGSLASAALGLACLRVFKPRG
ncbi:MAG TPA: Na+/H+ antiporter NhaA [Caulobacteraceae bacterium]